MNTTKNGSITPSFHVSRDKWIIASSNSQQAQKRIQSKIATVKARQKRLVTVQATINHDIKKLRSEIEELEQFISLRDIELEQAQQAMEFALLGELS